MNNKKTPVILVDDHEMVRDGFYRIITTNKSFEVLGQFSTVVDTIESGLLNKCKILITDISIGKENGLTLLEYLKNNKIDCKPIVVSMHENSFYLQKAKALGVQGFLSKSEASNMLLNALESIRDGQLFFSDEIRKKMKHAESALTTFSKLYPKEKNVFLYLAKGASVKVIAAQMDISIKTVHAHRLNLYKKFGFNSSFDFTKFALTHGIISITDIESSISKT